MAIYTHGVTGPDRREDMFISAFIVFFLIALYAVTGVQQQGNGSQDFPAADPWIDENESDQEVHESDNSVEKLTRARTPKKKAVKTNQNGEIALMFV